MKFRVEHAAVQGHDSARQVIEAVGVLAKDPEVDVIVIARGGGALEDLLPFSDEGLLRAVAACVTPVVSAIGHEQDSPLLDLVADLRASTPTDVAKRIVPDRREEMARVIAMRDRARYVLAQQVSREQQQLATLRSRPALAEPRRMFDTMSEAIEGLLSRSQRCLDHRLSRAHDDISHRLARVRTLSPLATLQRGYAVVQTGTGAVVTSSTDVSPGERVVARLASGSLQATVDSTTAHDTADLTSEKQ